MKDLFAATKDNKKAAYGMEPELMSCITQRVALELLGWTDMKRILWEAKTSVFHQ